MHIHIGCTCLIFLHCLCFPREHLHCPHFYLYDLDPFPPIKANKKANNKGTLSLAHYQFQTEKIRIAMIQKTARSPTQDQIRTENDKNGMMMMMISGGFSSAPILCACLIIINFCKLPELKLKTKIWIDWWWIGTGLMCELETDWNRIGNGLAQDCHRIGKPSALGWKLTGGRLALDWQQIICLAEPRLAPNWLLHCIGLTSIFSDWREIAKWGIDWPLIGPELAHWHCNGLANLYQSVNPAQIHKL